MVLNFIWSGGETEIVTAWLKIFHSFAILRRYGTFGQSF